jgi:hypothetical protein
MRETPWFPLEMGLIDEAKQIIETWMARWLTLGRCRLYKTHIREV